MAIVRIFELRGGHQPIIREAQVPEEYLSEVITYLYEKGAAHTGDPRGEKEEDIIKHTFKVRSPYLRTLVKEIEAKWPEIKFVEVKTKRGK